VRQRTLTTNISLDEGTCDLDLVFSVADYFGLRSAAAKKIIKDVAIAVATWEEVAAAHGARKTEIKRMESAFVHADLKRALAL